MNRTCPNCKVVFWKDPGESLGAMYLDYAVAAATFLALWLVLELFTNLGEVAKFGLLSAAAVGSVMLFYPLTRSVWTVLVYLSGGIEHPPMHLVRGRKKASY